MQCEAVIEPMRFLACRCDAPHFELDPMLAQLIGNEHKAVEVDQRVECLLALHAYHLSENDKNGNPGCSARLADVGVDRSKIKSRPIENGNAAD